MALRIEKKCPSSLLVDLKIAFLRASGTGAHVLVLHFNLYHALYSLNQNLGQFKRKSLYYETLRSKSLFRPVPLLV